jgi:tripartite-type tricarboxylate transporter receptor subunit TctC
MLRGWGMAGWLALAAAAGPALAAEPLTIVEFEGSGAPTAVALELLQPALEKALGRTVTVTQESVESGGAALDRIASAPADGSILFVESTLAQSVVAAAGAGIPGQSLSDLVPIAKLTTGLSAALVVPADGGAADYQALAALQSPDRALRIGYTSPFRVPLALLEQKLGSGLERVPVDTRDELLQALAEGSVDAGFLTTVSLLTAPGAQALPVRAVVTFGAGRNPQLGGVPTFAEIAGEPKAAITTSVAVFAPPGLAEREAKALTDGFIAAGADPAVQAAAKARFFPLDVSGPDVVRETLAREARVIGELGAAAVEEMP